MCVCLCGRYACAPPLLAGVCGASVCAWARVSAAPHHSWLGCWGVCVCLCACSACTSPLLAGVRSVNGRAWAQVSAVARDSWLGCWGVCVCLCACSTCTPPLLAGLCAVGVRAWARVLAAPRHSWLGCWGVCVLVCAPRLYPATPGWAVRLWCLWLGSGFGCAPPLLALVLGCVCAWCALRLCPATAGWGVRCGRVSFSSGFGCALPLLAGVLGCLCVCLRTPLVPRSSWLGCAAWVRVLRLGFWLRPATPGWDVGVCVCLCGRSACAQPLLAGVCGAGGCAWARFLAALRHSWLGCWGVCVCLCACSACTPPLLAGVCRLGVCAWARVSGAPPTPGSGVGVCVCLVRAPSVPRHCWLGCAVWAGVIGLGVRPRSATPRWGVGVCVCLCARSACTPPLLACVCGVGACAWARVSAAPHHSWLGCWGVCVLVWALRLCPATPGWGVRCGCVCLGLGFGCAPPLLAGVLGCVCVFVCLLRLYLATSGWGARCGWPCLWAQVSAVARDFWLGCWGVCVRLCACSTCTPPLLAGLGSRFSCAPQLLAGLLGCVCACVRAPLVPRHSWLGCWGVCVLGAHSAGAPPLLAGVCSVGGCDWARGSAALRHSWLGCWGVCLFVCALRLYPAPLGSGVRRGCVCLGSGFCCAPPLLAGMLGCVCACVGAPLVPHHSWLGCAVRVCVLGLGFRLRPTTPGWGVGVCVCVCVLAPLVPRHSWLGCAVWMAVLGLRFRLWPATPGWGVGVCVCVCVLAPLVPRHSSLGCAPWVCVLGLAF